MSTKLHQKDRRNPAHDPIVSSECAVESLTKTASHDHIATWFEPRFDA
jgi:hypothetical protein